MVKAVVSLVPSAMISAFLGNQLATIRGHPGFRLPGNFSRVPCARRTGSRLDLL